MQLVHVGTCLKQSDVEHKPKQATELMLCLEKEKQIASIWSLSLLGERVHF